MSPPVVALVLILVLLIINEGILNYQFDTLKERVRKLEERRR